MAVFHIEHLLLVALAMLACSPPCSCLADPPEVITQQDKRVLTQLYDTFLNYHKSEGSGSGFKQFAVLYYGNPSNISTCVTSECREQTEGKVFMTTIMKNFDTSKCNYIAARKTASNSHTENIIVWSLYNGQSLNCPKNRSPGENVYLVSYNSPCADCDRELGRFVSSCQGGNFKRLIIGYKQEYKDINTSKNKIYQLRYAAMTKI